MNDPNVLIEAIEGIGSSIDSLCWIVAYAATVVGITAALIVVVLRNLHHFIKFLSD